MKKLLVLLTMVGMLCAFTLSASASDFKFYGSLRMQTFTEDYSDVLTGNPSDQDTKWKMLGTSRIGSNIKLSDDITGLFELGVGDDALTVRHFYGEYNFGAGKILVGQTWHPVGVPFGFYTNQVGNGDDGLLSYGQFYSGRVEMIKLTFGGLQLAFIEPKTNTAIAGGDDVDITLPQIAAGYSFKYENLTLDAVGAYQTYDEENHIADLSYDIDSYVFKVGAKGDFGPFMLGATYGWGQNVDSMGTVAKTYYSQSTGQKTQKTKFNSVTNKIADIDTTGYTIVAAYKANDMFRFEAGYGYVKSENFDDTNDVYFSDDDACSYYLQAAITVAPGFTITPEIGRIDFGEFPKGSPDAEINYFGAKWQINF